MSAPPNVHSEPATLPLDGAQPGATLTLRPLLCAEMISPPGWFEREEGAAASLRAIGIGVPSDARIRVPIVAFLLEHPRAGHVLVDTGFHASVAAGDARERVRNLGPVGWAMARGMHMRPEQAIAAQLRELGIAPDQLGLIVMTHLHFDHASALCDYPDATVLVSRPEWIAAWGPRPFMHGYRTAQIDPRPSYRTIDFAADEARPEGPFSRTLDVFGDRSLTLVSTPGHSPGHLSLIVRLRDRDALIVGDAAYTLGTLRADARPWRAEDTHAFEASLAELKAWDAAHPDAVVIPGHDMPAWEGLEQLYS